MARQQRKKARAHGVAAHSKAASNQQETAKPEDALGAAAVAATFGEDAEADADAAPLDEDEPQDAQSLSRGQRKRLKRRAAFMRKMGIVSRVAQDQASQAKAAESGVFAELDALQSSLFQADEDLKKKKKTTDKKKPLSGRQRQKLAVRELGQLKAVQTHASFQSDPFAAIQAHLQNTVVQANHELLQKTTAAAAKKRGNKMDIEA